MALEESNVIPIIKLSNNNGPYYPLSVPEAVYSTHNYEVQHDIGEYKKGELIDPLTTLDEILSKILGAQADIRHVNFVGVTNDDPGANDGYPPYLELDDGTIYTSDDYTEGDVVIYNNDDASNVLCVFYKKAADPHGKWLLISDDIIYVGDENNPPPERSKKKVLWLDTTTKTIDTYTDSPEMESLKNLVYKLMMSYGKVVKLVENGVKPTDAGGVIGGTEVSNWRRELINAADPEQPVDVIDSDTLENISIYGNDYTGNGSLYRAVFTPNGFTDKRVKWQFSNGQKTTPLKDETSKIIGYAEIHSVADGELEKPECTLELYLYDEDTGTKSPIVYTDIVDTAIELVAVYNLEPYTGDDAVTGTKTIKVGGEKPETDVEPTVKSVCIKMDTADNFAAHKDDLIDGELLFYTDKAKFVVYRCFKNDKGIWTQKFYALQTDESEGKGLTEEQLYELALKYLQFKDPNGKIYKVFVTSEGEWKLRAADSAYEINSTDGSYAYGGSGSRYISMSTIYCGGGESTEGKASHNFVEIYNSSLTKDYNLSGAFLLYTDCSTWSGKNGYVWNVLQLQGTVKAGSTFTVRGARSNRDDACFIKVDKYDQEWYDDNGKLIEFNVNRGGFYLVNGMTVDNVRVLPTVLREAILNKTFKTFSSSTLSEGYIDGFGFRNLNTMSNIPCEISPLDISPASVTSETDPNRVTADQCIFTKNFILDPSKQALKAYTSKDTTSLWTFIKIDKQTEKLGNSEQYYWPDSYKKSYTPGSVDTKHDFYNYGRTKFDPKQPNVINVTFGKQATATVTYDEVTENEGITYYSITNDTALRNEAAVKNHAFNSAFSKVTTSSAAVYTDHIKYAKHTANEDASRCFNWVSVGNFDEYVEYRKKGEEAWIRQYSIIPKDANDADSMVAGQDAPFIEFYKRFSWPAGYDNVWVTTHKRIIRNLTAGIYEYRIGRDNDVTYLSPTKEFLVKDDTQVTDFRFVQVTDQQGFNWAEYQAWKRACYMIDKNRKEGITRDNELIESAKEFDFSVNTGDIGQSGNRVSEFIDYFQARSPISDTPEMFTIGNNDLCSRNPTKFGDGNDFTSKYNHINVRKYYTFELDPLNVDSQGKSNYIIPSIELPMDTQGLSFKTFTNIPIDSVYSFNYGKYHFISLNSEYTKATVSVYNKIVYNDKTIEEVSVARLVNSINARLENWLKQDLLLWKPESYPSTTDANYMYGKKYYWYRDEYGNVSANRMELISGKNYIAGTDYEHPAYGADEIGKTYVKKEVGSDEYKEFSVSSSEILVHEPSDCSKCLVYMHEIPYTIVTDKFIGGAMGREGSKLNTNNTMGTYRFSRLFNRYGIRIIFGGHKHTFSMSRPVLDAPNSYLENGIIYPDFDDTVCGTNVTAALSRQPLIQYLNIGDFSSLDSANGVRGTRTFVGCKLTEDCTYGGVLHTAGYYLYTNTWKKLTVTTVNKKTYYSLDFPNEGTGITARIQLVTKFTAPSYVMSQATGFKLISNAELMCSSGNIVPWILTYCNENITESGAKGPGRNQLDPMYITYDLDSATDTAVIKMKVVKNIFDVSGDATEGYVATCTLNTQNPILENSILFEQTLENI